MEVILKDYPFKDVAEYLIRNGMTPIPTKDGSKAPYHTISRKGIEKANGIELSKDDSFHIPIEIRIRTARKTIDNVKNEPELQDGIGIGATYLNGWHDKNFVVLDFDGEFNEFIDEIYETHPTFACRGNRGVKLVYAIDSKESINYTYIKIDGEGHIEVFGNCKHLAVFRGEHPKSTVNKPIRYRQNLDFDIPVLNWDEFQAELNQMASKYKFKIKEKVVHTIDKTPTRVVNRSFNLLKIGIEEAIQPYDAVEGRPNEYNCTHTVHGSAGGNKNLVYNTLTDQWFCAADTCRSGGGVIQWMAVKYGLVNCWDCVGSSPVKGNIWRKLMLSLINDGYFTLADYGEWISRNGGKS
jgi:hypothetical protein